MKQTFLTTCLLATMFISCDSYNGATAEIPSVVINSLQSQFPDAKDLEWETNQDGFEAEFDIKKIEYTVFLTPDGNLTKFKYDTKLSQLPAAIIKTIESNYDKNSIDDIEVLKIGENTYYQIEFDGNVMDKEIVFNSNGEVNQTIKYLD